MEHARDEGDVRLEHRALLEAVRTLASTLDVNTVLERLLYLTHQMLAFDYCTILLIAEDGRRLEVAARHGYTDSIVSRTELMVGRGVTGRVAETGEAIIVPDVSKELRYVAGLQGARSEMVVPLTFGGRVLGVFDVQSPELNAFTERDREFLEVLAGIAGVAIVNARAHLDAIKHQEEVSRRRELEHELDLARVIQERLLPRADPVAPGYELAGMNLPSETISGDYFDYVELPHGHLGIVVADVSGKGVPAALLAASLQGTLRSHIENLYSIATIMERANNSLCRSTTAENFATLFYGVLDPGGALTYVNAGHNPPIILRTDGSCERLTEGGTIFGMFTARRYREGRVDMHPGDYLIAFTDGLPDAASGEEFFGDERIIETARRTQGSPARLMASLLITEADSFIGPGAPVDDMTVVVARRLGTREAP
ncbi:MAG: SpoIIE family protein phosphatase [Candidatus Eisenbacteria bacterium]|nr:SpoIIE family protein phosphatase [Candidatus Eisenbacteria bacterium]